MPGASKSSCNSFFMFMQYYRAREERKGVRFEKGMESVVQPAGEEWRRMTPEQKAVYKEKAREYKTSAEFRAKKRRTWNQAPKPKSNYQEKLKSMLKNPSSTDDEEFLDDAESIFFTQEDGRLNKKREMQREDFKRALMWNLGAEFQRNILLEPFYVMSVQNYYETPEHQYSPCEIAFVEFSLAKGITKHFHAILKPMYVPMNLKNRVVSIASSTHHIMPAEGRLPAESREDYRVVVNEIKKFYINKSYYRVFVLLKQMNSVQGAAKAMRDKVSSKQFVPSDSIMCVEDLLTLLCSFRETAPTRSDFHGFNKIVDGCGWDNDLHPLCSFHSRVQSKYCALGMARKTIYYLLMRLKDVFQLNITPSHIPLSIQHQEFSAPSQEDQLAHFENGEQDNYEYENNYPETSHNQDYEDFYGRGHSMSGTGDVHNAPNLYPDRLAQNFDDDSDDFQSGVVKLPANLAVSRENYRNETMSMTSSGLAGPSAAAATASAALDPNDESENLTRYREKTAPTVPAGLAGVQWQKGPYDYEQAQYDAQVQYNLQFENQMQQEMKRVNIAVSHNVPNMTNDSSFDTENDYTNNKYVLTYSSAYVTSGPPEPPGFATVARRYQRSGSNVSTDDNLQSTTDAMASLDVSYNNVSYNNTSYNNASYNNVSYNSVPQPAPAPAPYIPVPQAQPPQPVPYSSVNAFNSSSGRLPNTKALCSRFLLAPVPRNPQQN